MSRLRFICQLSDAVNDLPLTALNALVSESVDIVVHCARVGGHPRVLEVIAVEDLVSGHESAAFTATDLFASPRTDGPLTWSGNLPARATRALERAGFDVRALLDDCAPAAAPVAVLSGV